MGKLISVESFPQISVDCGDYDFLENPQNNTHFVISSLLHVMNNKLPIKGVPPTQIVFSENIEKPNCDRNSGFIFLAVNPNTWNQLAYQLAHEMCHRVIPNEVTKNLRWLEESICELSSYYFLPQLSKYWRRKNVNLVYSKTNKPYYPAFEEYVKNDRQKATAVDLPSFSSTPIPNELQSLIDDCEIREKNAYIANSLLPIFDRRSNTWRAIPFLSNLKSNESLETSLREWITLAPTEARAGLQRIALLFGVQVLLS